MIFFLMFLTSVDQKKQQVLGWMGSQEKLMTSQEEGLTSWSRNHTQKTGQVLTLTSNHNNASSSAYAKTRCCHSRAASYCMSASDPVHKYIAVRTVKTPGDHAWLSAESGAATSVLLTTATTHPGSRPPHRGSPWINTGRADLSDPRGKHARMKNFSLLLG